MDLLLLEVCPRPVIEPGTMEPRDGSAEAVLASWTVGAKGVVSGIRFRTHCSSLVKGISGFVARSLSTSSSSIGERENGVVILWARTGRALEGLDVSKRQSLWGRPRSVETGTSPSDECDRQGCHLGKE